MGNSLLAWVNACKTAVLTSTSAEAALPVTNLSNDQGSTASAWQTLTGAVTPTLTITPLARTTIRAVGLFRTNLTASASVLVQAFAQPLDTTLDLDFTSGVLDGRITFTRASVGTYFNVAGTLQTAISGAARFDYDPVTHAAKGLLIEESRTNIVLQSADLTQAAWTKGSCSITANATAAPDGTTTAGRIVEAAASASHGVNQLISKAASAITYTYSVFLKAGTRTAARVMMEGSVSGTAFCDFDLSSGIAGTPAVTGAWASASAVQVPVGNGWYRCCLTATSNTDTGVFADVYLLNGGTPTYLGDGTSGLYAWGADIETGAFVTSYIPTAGSAVTRAADIASMPWVPTYPFAMVGEGIVSALSPSVAEGLAVLTDGTTANRIAIRANSSATSTMGAAFTVASVNTVVVATANTVTPGTAFRVGASVTSTDLTVCGNGGTTVTALGAAPTGLTTLTFGQTTTPGNALNGCLRRLRYWPRALTAGELVNATSATLGLQASSTITAVNGQAVAVFPADVSIDYVTVRISDPSNPDNHINVPLAFAGPVWQPLTAMAWSSSMGRDAISDTVLTRGGQTYVDLRASARRWEIALDGVRDTEAFTQLDVLARACLSGGNVLVCPQITSPNLQYEATFGVLKPTADVTFPLGVGARRSWRASLSERL